MIRRMFGLVVGDARKRVLEPEAETEFSVGDQRILNDLLSDATRPPASRESDH